MFAFGGFNRFDRLMNEMAREMTAWDQAFFSEPLSLTAPKAETTDSKRSGNSTVLTKSGDDNKAVTNKSEASSSHDLINWFNHAGFQTKMDIVDKPDSFEVTLDLPGVKPEEVKVEVKDNVLTVSGERKKNFEEKTDTYTRIERSSGSFTRSIRLGKEVNQDAIAAHNENGVLHISLPKKKVEETKPKTIPVAKSGPAKL